MKKKKAEHTTADKILESAQKIFIQKGFKGSSINDIARDANINKSLIYHHFSNKEDLWRAVKKHILNKHVGSQIMETNFPMESFKNYLKSFVSIRFKFYDNNPELVRLIAWQRLENTQEDVGGIQDKKFSTLIPQLIEFQKRGEISPDLDPEMVEYMIMTTASMAFMESPVFFHDQSPNDKKVAYLELLVESLYRAFSSTNEPEKPLKKTVYHYAG